MNNETNYIDSDVNELILFSDNCPGQNKNHTMERTCMALIDTGPFNKFQKFYPVRGHSFLPVISTYVCVIKRSLRKSDRIYAVHDNTEIIIIKSSNNNNHFAVKEFATADMKPGTLAVIVL